MLQKSEFREYSDDALEIVCFDVMNGSLYCDQVNLILVQESENENSTTSTLPPKNSNGAYH